MTSYASERRLLEKPPVALFQDIQKFLVAETTAGEIVGCGAVHVFWEDLAEVRTLAVHRGHQGVGIGSALLVRLIDAARRLGIKRLFCLTFEVDFFARHGFTVIQGVPVTDDVRSELELSFDEGTAEFLDLARVRPNTLGNTRMLLALRDRDAQVSGQRQRRHR